MPKTFFVVISATLEAEDANDATDQVYEALKSAGIFERWSVDKTEAEDSEAAAEFYDRDAAYAGTWKRDGDSWIWIGTGSEISWPPGEKES